MHISPFAVSFSRFYPFRWPSNRTYTTKHNNNDNNNNNNNKNNNNNNDDNDNDNNYKNNSTTVLKEEVDKFCRLSNNWWDPEGHLKPLHEINPIRVKYITTKIKQYYNNNYYNNNNNNNDGDDDDDNKNSTANAVENDHHKLTPLKGIEIADIGCGGGLLSECLSRLGAKVTGVDAAKTNTAIAKLHASNDPLLKFHPPTYLHTTAEQLVLEKYSFDVVCSLEVIEHVSDVPLFVSSLSRLVKPGGLLFISTINKTLWSYLSTILIAEHILAWCPTGTHDWKNYVPPQHLKVLLANNGIVVHEVVGLTYNFLDFNNPSCWNIGSSDISSNYFMVGVKKHSE